jgi:hypothetical protein
MTKQDWDFVQGVWDMVDDLWPEIERWSAGSTASHRRRSRHVRCRRPMACIAAAISRWSTIPTNLPAPSWTKPASCRQRRMASGHDPRRVDQGTRHAVKEPPVLLNMGVITRHLGEVIHDITHREAVVQVRKILSDDRDPLVGQQRLGPEYPSAWALAREHRDPQHGQRQVGPAMIAIARHLNKGISLVGLGFRFTAILVQPIGLSNIDQRDRAWPACSQASGRSSPSAPGLQRDRPAGQARCARASARWTPRSTT